MNERINSILDETNLNWTVREEKLTTESGIIVPNKKAIIREDINEVLSVHGDGYFIYQNHQLMELLDKVSDKVGLPIHKGGYFGNGEKLYIQLKSDDMILNTDRIEGFITGVNSFDGSTSLAFGLSNITISCMNTFYSAFRSLNTKVRHTKNMIYKLDEICIGLEKVLSKEKTMFQEIKKLSETRYSKETEDWVTRLLFNLENDIELEDTENISKTTQNKISKFYVDLNGEIRQKGDNLWGLFSGVTKYTTHSVSKEGNEEGKMFGFYGNRERTIFNKLVELV
jgi:co-chaperonin GroES (HSP10)